MGQARQLKLSGIAEWARVFEQNRDMEGYGGKYEPYKGACTIDLITDMAQIEMLQEAGCGKKPKQDDQGRGWRVRFDRKFDTGYEWSSGAPIVSHLDGTPWDLEKDGLIGNGSQVEIGVTIYDTQYNNSGTRLDWVMVTDHVVYENPNPKPKANVPPNYKAPTVDDDIITPSKDFVKKPSFKTVDDIDLPEDAVLF